MKRCRYVITFLFGSAITKTLEPNRQTQSLLGGKGKAVMGEESGGVVRGCFVIVKEQTKQTRKQRLDLEADFS